MQSLTAAAAEPARGDQATRRRAVIATATALADAGGYDAVTMKTVADRAGVALATIYRWFTSKDHLLAEALLGWVQDIDTELRATRWRSTSAADRLAAMMTAVGEHIAARPRLV